MPAAGRRALVLGGGIAGLLAARALAGHFDRVTVVDRDRLPAGPEPRAGAPQSSHIHVLLARGAELLEQLFPGLLEEVTAAGAVTMEWPADALALGRQGWSQRFTGGLRLVSCTHQLLEWSVRRRLLALPAVELVERHEAVALLAAGTRVAGAALRPRPGGAPVTEVEADIVVDASGRGSRAPRWLEALGVVPPPEEHVDALVGYASRFYARPSPAPDWKAVYLRGRASGNTRGGVLVPVEGDRWLVTLTGIGADQPPTDGEGFLAFAATLRSPVLHEAIRDAAPLTAVRGFRRTANRLRHWERAGRLPDRLVVMGDAACALNPIYGQGITAAAIGAALLAGCLDEQRRAGDGLDGFARRFQRRLARANGSAWLMATREDLRYPTTTGRRAGPATRLVHRYVDRVLDVACEDRRVNLAAQRVLHMLAPGTTLLHPAVAAAALRGLRQAPLTSPPAAPAAAVSRLGAGAAR